MRRDRKGRRRPVLALVVALALVGSLAAAGAALARPLGCNGSWRLCDRHFNQVVLPATHNAMSAQSLGWSLPNQQVGIPDQLRLGVRGLLLDTYYAHREPNGTVVTDRTPTAQSELYLCHVACQLGATPLIDVLRSIRSFLERHPRNVLVIVNEDSVSPDDFAREVKRAKLLRHVWRGRTGPRWPTLRKMIRKRRQLVVLAERDSGTVPWYHEAYGGILQETAFTWPVPELLTDPARWTASCAPNRGGRTGSLFLLNHWSPPLAPNPATSALVNATDVLVGRARACRAARGSIPNIVAVDMFLSGGLFDAVRRLNAEAS
ncbi:MAG TPA: hypothetical protein VFQ12_04870 [Thermoleophilaceae bacterium]|nr:hypothetical protein [Thermoleophilaceae bacterium]